MRWGDRLRSGAPKTPQNRVRVFERLPRTIRGRHRMTKNGRGWPVTVAIAMALGAIGCESPVSVESLEVYLRSDLSAEERSGLSVEVTVETLDEVEVARAEIDAFPLDGEALGTAPGAFLFAFDELPAGLARVRVALSGEGVETRRANTVVATGAGLTQARVVLAREPTRTCVQAADCDPDEPCIERVLCDPDERRCLRFRAPFWVEGCACETASDCPPPEGCGATSCEAYSCVTRPDPSRCGPREACRAAGGAVYLCDPATCLGRAAGEECRPARSPCDAPEHCEVGDVEACPPDVGQVPYVACVGASGAGYCAPREGGEGAGADCGPGGEGCACRAECRSGEACRVPGEPCRVGALECTGGTASCLDSGVQPDGTVCGEATDCADAPLCSEGACMPGEPRPVGTECGPIPVEGGCFAPSRCDGAGACLERVRVAQACDRPLGEPPAEACQGYRCSARGDCLLAILPDGIDPDGCFGRAPDTRCGTRLCRLGACVTVPDDRYCRIPCRTGACEPDLGYTCELAPLATPCQLPDGSSGRCDASGTCR